MNYIFSGLSTLTDPIQNSDFVSYYTNINWNMTIQKVKPNIRQAVELWLIPKIGRTFYNDLATKFNEDTLNAEETLALTYFKDAAAHYTICKMLENNAADISELGFNYTQDTDRTVTSVPQWFLYNATFNTCRTGDQFVEIGLQYVYDNQAQFSGWTAPSDVMLINDAKTLSDNIPVGRSVLLFDKLRPTIKKAQDQLIKPLITATNYNNLIDGITNDNLTADESTLLDQINRFLCPYVLEKALPFLNLHFENGKIETVTITDGVKTRQAARNEQIQALKTKLIEEYEQNKSEFIKWLSDNKATYNITTAPTNAAKVTQGTYENSVFWG